MKSIRLFILITSVFFIGYFPKTFAQTKFYYGPRIGFGLSTFVGKDADYTNFPVGTIIGFYTQTEISEKFSIDAELNYISMGSLLTFNKNTAEQTDYKISLGYISLPVNLNYQLYKQFHLQIGLQTSAIITALTEQKYQNVLTEKKNIGDYHAIDVGPTLGCFYQFEKGLQLGVRYYRGIQTVSKNDLQIYNSGIQFLLTYKFSRAAKELGVN